MQAGEIIWFLAGLGLGLTIAMGLLAGMALLDRRRVPSDPEESAPDDDAGQELPVPRRKVPPVPEPMPRVPEDRKPAPRPIAPLSPPPARGPITLDAKVVETPAKSSDLAVEIARVQTSVAEQTIELPPAEPVPVIAAPAPPIVEPEPALPPAASPPPPKPADEAPAQLTSPVEPPPAPKVPPLPKVTPARKFAPALPPKTPENKG